MLPPSKPTSPGKTRTARSPTLALGVGYRRCPSHYAHPRGAHGSLKSCMENNQTPWQMSGPSYRTALSSVRCQLALTRKLLGANLRAPPWTHRPWTGCPNPVERKSVRCGCGSYLKNSAVVIGEMVFVVGRLCCRCCRHCCSGF